MLAARLLHVQYPADQCSCVADDEPAWFKHELTVRLLDRRDDDLGEGTGRKSFLLAVMDAESAAHVENADWMALRPQRLDQNQPLRRTLLVRLTAQNGRAQVH